MKRYIIITDLILTYFVIGKLLVEVKPVESKLSACLWENVKIVNTRNTPPGILLSGSDFVVTKLLSRTSDYSFWLVSRFLRGRKVGIHDLHTECNVSGSVIRKMDAFPTFWFWGTRISAYRKPDQQLACLLFTFQSTLIHQFTLRKFLFLFYFIFCSRCCRDISRFMYLQTLLVFGVWTFYSLCKAKQSTSDDEGTTFTNPIRDGVGADP